MALELLLLESMVIPSSPKWFYGMSEVLRALFIIILVVATLDRLIGRHLLPNRC